MYQENKMANSKKPDQVYPSNTQQSTSPMPTFIPDPSIKGVSWDQLLQNRGIRFLHNRAMLCPNIRSINDMSHNPACPLCDNDGLLYYEEKEIYGVFYSNSIEKNFEVQGLWEMGAAQITFPAEYTDGTIAEFQTYDKLTIPDFPARMWQLVEYNPNVNGGVTRMRYPIDTIDLVTSAQNNVRVDFVEGTDYTINGDGDIAWITPPSYNATIGVGEVISVAYHANPVYKVLQPLRELRVSQELVNGVKIARRLPQQILVKRDFLVNGPDKET